MARDSDLDLDKGHVFLDDHKRAYLVRNWGDEPWLFIWQNRRWVSLRKVRQFELLPNNLTPEEQAKYLEVRYE